MKKIVFFGLLVFCASSILLAVSPRDLINYQGVLRDASSQPLDGAYSMVFRLFSADVAGDEIFVDTHTAVTVTGGLFNVTIGGVGGVGTGIPADGSGPGQYGYLPRVFADYRDVFLEVEVNGEILSPRTRIVAAAYALNTRYVNGVEATSAGPLDLYVDAVAGNDDNSGIFPSAPKRTIQAAVDRIPGFLGGDVTVYIAPGFYPEQVQLTQRSLRGPYTITLLGDGPGVEISGEGIRDFGIEISGIPSFVVDSIKIIDTTGQNLRTFDSGGTVRYCELTSTPGTPMGSGAIFVRGFVWLQDSTVSDHSGNGVDCGGRCFFSNVEITGNLTGIDVGGGNLARFMGSATITGNVIGVRAYQGRADFSYRPDVQVTGNSADLTAIFLGVVFNYGSSDVGSCVAYDYSLCTP